MPELIYTDGACSQNGTVRATGGFGMYLKQSCFGDDLKINRKGETMRMELHDKPQSFYVTNIRMEGLAIIATMFLYAERFVFDKPISDPVRHLNECFLKHQQPLKLLYGPTELVRSSSTEERSFEIVTDSKFWMDVIENPKWMASWVSKGILMQKKNPDLLLLVYYYSTLFKQNSVRMILTHVRSHQRGKRTTHADGNDEADVLATSSANNLTTDFMSK